MKVEELRIKYPSGFEHAKMFELGKVSSGKAAELAGMSRVEFFETCSRYRVSIFNYPPEELEQQIRTDLETARRLSVK
ncbi:MAG: UPF0175 family protein [Deltaproteobacteria bacterium]|nr:UPF0175 family protein [Deltaproteobacteria bacterium]